MYLYSIYLYNNSQCERWDAPSKTTLTKTINYLIQGRSPCHHGRECYTSTNQSINRSINQSIDQKPPSHSINQSIHNLLLIFIDSTNQTSKQSINQLSVRDILSMPNQSINRQVFISKSVFPLNCSGLQVLIVFYRVLGKEKTNGTVRWDRGCGGGERVNWAWGLSVGKRIRNIYSITTWRTKQSPTAPQTHSSQCPAVVSIRTSSATDRTYHWWPRGESATFSSAPQTPPSK